MGLDTSHDCWHGPYSSFTRWRHYLAQAAGYSVLAGTKDSNWIPSTDLDWDGITGRNPGCFQGEWLEAESDPLIYLLAHSDCDGVLHPAQANALADRLVELLPQISVLATEHQPMIAKTEQFIAGLRRAVEAGEDVDFH